ncbi:mitochondrial import inner membrane translocase subunit Tim8 B-like [Myotis yumanensis]|uniref:mitochondrial import inner membrane translocase subunit Tim8 B-like n=1 Tax=Myotis yumanensis TaxID=159337 RepID=UPI0038D01F5E
MAELGEADEAELQCPLVAQQRKAQLTTQKQVVAPLLRVHHFMELRWDKCVEKPGNRLDQWSANSLVNRAKYQHLPTTSLDPHTENCLFSSVDRFIVTILAITSHCAQNVQKGGQ